MPIGLLQRLHGYRIYNCGDLPELLDRYGICEVLVSSPQIPESKLVHLRRLGLGVSYLNLRIEREPDWAAPKLVNEIELSAAQLKEA